MKYAVVKDGIVQNVIEYDGKTKYEVDGDLVKVPKDAVVSIGFLHKKSRLTKKAVFTAPPTDEGAKNETNS